MDRAQQLLAEFSAQAGSIAPDLFDVGRALDIVERCRELELDLLGIEGFEACAVGIMPRLDWIFDGSTDPRAYDAARTFLESYGAASLHFEFTLADPQEALSDADDAPSEPEEAFAEPEPVAAEAA